jgi:hypothetical protein
MGTGFANPKLEGSSPISGLNIQVQSVGSIPFTMNGIFVRFSRITTQHLGKVLTTLLTMTVTMRWTLGIRCSLKTSIWNHDYLRT